MKINIPGCILVSIAFSIVQVNAQQIPVPENYSIVDTLSGDLDNDGEKELVVAYNTNAEVDKGSEDMARELTIYKSRNGKWIAWKSSKQALYSSRGGGMMGDPYEQMTIEKGILQISQSGGSSWKWGHTDKYRYQQGELYLIGYSSSYGKPCEYWLEIDFNLSTGKMLVKKEYEDCDSSDQAIYKRENETVVKKGIRITLQDRNGREIKIVTPKYRHEVYIATKLDEN